MSRRPVIPDFKCALSNADLPSIATLQDGVDSLDLLFRVSLHAVRVSQDFDCLGSIEGRPAQFSCERRPLSRVATGAYAEIRTAWSFAYAFGADGEMLSSVLAGLAADAYAATTGGVFFDPEHGSLRGRDLLRRDLNAILAVELGRLDLYERRYPEEAYPGPAAQPRLRTIVHTGEVEGNDRGA